MTELRKRAILTDLSNSEAAVKTVVESVNKARFLDKPNPDSWSMSEIVEHIIMVEKGIFFKIQKLGADAPTKPIKAELDDKTIVSIISNREMKVKAPEHFTPKGLFTTQEEALQGLRTHREALENFISTTDLPLKNIGFPHFAVGMLNAENWFTFMAGHCKRHAMQMEEIKASHRVS